MASVGFHSGSPQEDRANSDEAESRGKRKGMYAFNTSDGSDPADEGLEDVFSKSAQTKGVTGHWFGIAWIRDILAVESRRRQSLEMIMYRDDEGAADSESLLTRGYARTESQSLTMGKRSCYRYCMFGSISGLTILAILLLLNILLASATLFWTSPIDDTLSNWGRPGSGTEDLAWYPTDFTRGVLPIPCHSHNDYWRRVPLFSALRTGCISVEADVWLFDNELYVGHNTASLTRNRTFASLYVDPIVKILEQQNPSTPFYNGTSHGVFDAVPDQTLTLLVDLKTSGKETWPVVLEQLEPLRERGWLSFVENGLVNMRPVTVVGTGNTPFDILTANSTYRDAFFDAPLETMWEPRHHRSSSSPWSSSADEPLDEDEDDSIPSSPTNDIGQGLSGTSLSSQFDPTNSYYASANFGTAVGKVWGERLNMRQKRTIRGHVRGAHRRGLRVRYWELPAWPLGLRNHVWDVLVREGVDVLNVDDLRGVARVVW